MSDSNKDQDAFAIMAAHAQARQSQQVAASIAQQREHEAAVYGAIRATLSPATALIFAASQRPDIRSESSLLLQTVIEFGSKTTEGQLVVAVTVPWLEIIRELKRDPAFAFQMTSRMWEEMIAGAYKRAGWDEVTLTPRSGDGGRDVIAIKNGLGTVRVIDQVKAYKPGHLVTADDVRALMGVLHADSASKGFLTTTSDFAPKLSADPLIAPYIPSRLGLVTGEQLFERLHQLVEKT